MLEKLCNRCRVVKPLLAFDLHTGGRGGLCAVCHVCTLQAHRDYNQKNYERIRETNARRYAENKASMDARNREYCLANAERIKSNGKKWRAENRSYLNNQKREWAKEQRRTNPGFRALDACRRRLRRAIASQKGVKVVKTQDLLGCSTDFLKFWLELQFRPNMTWHNHGLWHIDHKQPCASFDLTDIAQQKLCFHYSNLQPLWAQENIAKGTKCPV